MASSRSHGWDVTRQRGRRHAAEDRPHLLRDDLYLSDISCLPSLISGFAFTQEQAFTHHSSVAGAHQGPDPHAHTDSRALRPPNSPQAAGAAYARAPPATASAAARADRLLEASDFLSDRPRVPHDRRLGDHLAVMDVERVVSQKHKHLSVGRAHVSTLRVRSHLFTLFLW